MIPLDSGTTARCVRSHLVTIPRGNDSMSGFVLYAHFISKKKDYREQISDTNYKYIHRDRMLQVSNTVSEVPQAIGTMVHHLPPGLPSPISPVRLYSSISASKSTTVGLTEGICEAPFVTPLG
jgi:hypothetical protein